MKSTYQQNPNTYQNASQSIEFKTNSDNVIAPETWHIVAFLWCKEYILCFQMFIKNQLVKTRMLIKQGINKYSNKEMNEWMNEWLNEYMIDWVNEWLSEWLSEWVPVRMPRRGAESSKHISYLLIGETMGC